MNRYQHTETGRVMIVTLGTFCAVTFVIGAFFTPCEGAGATYAVSALLALVLLNFYSLNVAVDETSVRLRFGVGLVKKIIPLDAIASAGPAKTTWLNGWGIRCLGDGWLYNVSSTDAVELRLKAGGRLLIGTDDQAGLLAALLAAGIRSV